MAQSAEQQVKEWLKDVDNAVKKFDKRDRRKILRKAANGVREDARMATPERVSRFLNPRYSKGKVVAKYAPGNLRKSVQTLTFRRSKDVFVGPRFAKKALPLHGKTVRSSDGYYAQMIYGSAREFRSRVLIPAIEKNAEKVRQIVLAEVRDKIPKYL